MKFIKQGLIYSPNQSKSWNKKYCLMPTPHWIEERKVIRIYFCCTDEKNNGSISFIEVDENNPKLIIYEHQEPVLGVGLPGHFDDCGVSPSSIIIEDSTWYLFYVGFQRTEKVPYMLFTGLATSNNGIDFERSAPTPIIDRTEKAPISSAAPFVMKEGSTYSMWHWHGLEWTKIEGKDYIKASIALSKSNDLKNWNLKKNDCIVPIDSEDEFSVGRPWVLKINTTYHMWYSIRFKKKLYRLGYSQSIDGVNWIRKDKELKTDVSQSGWDSEMMCYPSVVKIKDKFLLFYNGNNNGASGFGFAYLEEL